MSLLVTGSIGIDTVVSPFGRAEGVLGGSAVYFALFASQYVRVRLVGVVGEDFPDSFRAVLSGREVDLRGLEVRKGSKTFRWCGRYDGDMSQADTLEVDLNVLAERGPKVPEAFADSDTVFLANTHPALQRDLLGQLRCPKLVVCDTMNLWITTERESLLETLGVVHGVILNDGEIRQLTGRMNLIEAGEWILDRGPKFVVIKKGEHGALLVARGGLAAVPAFPTKVVHDPTGAGDSFAGGFMGFLDHAGNADFDTLRNALVRGTVAASFAIEDFSVRRVEKLARSEVDARVKQFAAMLRFV